MTLENNRANKVFLLCFSLLLWWMAFECLFSGPLPPGKESPGPLGAFGFFLLDVLMLRQGFAAKVRVDDEGFFSTDGLTKRSARWGDVAGYYFLPPIKGLCRPVLVGADGRVLLHGFPKIEIGGTAQEARQQAVIDFIEAHLVGKEIESPFLRAAFWVPAWWNVELSRQSLDWKIKHGLAWGAYVALWVSIAIGLGHYHFTAKSGVVAGWVNDWLFPSAMPPGFYRVVVVGCAVLLLQLAVAWQQRRLERKVLPFRFVNAVGAREAHPLG